MQEGKKAGEHKGKRGAYQQLRVWQEAHKFVIMIYKYTDKYPKSEEYGLVSQLRRASASVPTNIAEGYGYHTTDKKFLNYLYISAGSLLESDYLLLLSRDLGYLSEEDYSVLIRQKDKVEAYLTNLVKTIKN